MALKFWKKKQLKKTLSTLRKMCSYLEFFWYVFFRIWTEHENLQSKSPYSIQMAENWGQKNSDADTF